MNYRDLREFVEVLESENKLKHISAPVDREWEIACIARWVLECFGEGEQFALQFDQVRGYEIPVIVGLYSCRDFYARALGIDSFEILNHWSTALRNPLKPRIVTTAPVQEVVATGGHVDLSSLPVPVWTPGRDGGPYIPSAGIITRDPESGVQNMGVYRVQVQDAQQAGLFFGTEMQHGAIHYAKYCKQNKPMPVAFVIGGPPSLNFAAAAKTAYGQDELEIAGALAGSEIEVVAGETVDLLVPAAAEIVIEGLVWPEKRFSEGPFGEGLGYMNFAAPAPVVEVSAICRRRDAVFHGYVQQLGPSEGHVIWEMGLLGPLWFYLKDKLKLGALTDLAVLRGSAGLGMLAVQVKLGHTADARELGKVLSQINFGQKTILLVDDDIDIHDLETIQWALSSRVDWEHDIEVVKDMQTYQLDPAILAALQRQHHAANKPPYTSCMTIIDATLKCDTPEVSLPGRSHMTKAFERWQEYGLPKLKKRQRLERLLEKHSDEGIQFNLAK